MKHLPVVCCTLGLSILALGCGGPDMSLASGRVVYKDGSPVVGAIRVLRFEPTSDSMAKVKKAGSADIADDGSFDIYTKKPGDGVFNGKYAVTFSILESPTSVNGLVPDKYSRKTETPFTVEVSSDKSDYLFELEKL